MKKIIKQTRSETVWHSLESQQAFSQSLLWDLQQHYFAENGIEAWRQGDVPHYVTSNPTVAYSYAEIVLAFLRDQQQLAPNDQSSEDPLYICELGAGSGRFAFHFLSQLSRLCKQAHVALTAFRYVLTDFAEHNLDFWRQHPRFQPFIENGVLDMALFDITQSDQLTLQLSRKTITVGELDRPVVIIANYVWDSIPQDLYYINDEQCSQCLVSLLVDEDPTTLDTAELLERLAIHYDYQPLAETPYQEPYLQQLLADYQRTLTDTHLLFPATGLRCLQRLKALSQQGLLVLSADKGDHHLSALQGKPAPGLVHHGSFSLNVNYHAYKAFCEQGGGLTLFPNYHHNSVNVNCLLMLDDPISYKETQHAYQRYIQDFGPDDFYSITKHARQYIAHMTAEDILAYLRLSHYDSHQFARYLPRLMELAPALSQGEREDITNAVEQVWAWYFPLGEPLDLAYHIAYLLYELDDYPRALTYFKRSVEIYGPHTGTLYNMAVCHQLLGQHEEAEQMVSTVLKHDPENQQARALLAGYQTEEIEV